MILTWQILVAFVTLELELALALDAFVRGPMRGLSFADGLRLPFRDQVVPMAKARRR